MSHHNDINLPSQNLSSQHRVSSHASLFIVASPTTTTRTAAMMMKLFAFSVFLLSITNLASVSALASLASPRTTSTRTDENFLDFLKWGGSTPNFDVVAKTQEYTSEPGYIQFNLKEIPTDWYDDLYLFRGPIVGPINRQDLVNTNTQFGLPQSFPDLERQPFGFCVDPENPYRCLFFERWKATHTGNLELSGTPIRVQATNQQSISPAFPFAVTWTPEGKVIYECLATAVDRFEGNTKGKVAVFGLFETAGLSIDNSVGNPWLALLQKINRALNRPAQVFSKEEDIPSWWKSAARGADTNDV